MTKVKGTPAGGGGLSALDNELSEDSVSGAVASFAGESRDPTDKMDSRGVSSEISPGSRGREGLVEPMRSREPMKPGSAPPGVGAHTDDVASLARIGGTLQSESPGSRVVEGALRLQGKLKWSLPAYNKRGLPNDFEGFIQRGEPLNASSRMNCWEAVIYAAMEGGVLNADAVADAVIPMMADPVDYNKQMEDWLNLGVSRSLEECPPQAGDVLSFYGLSHIALSLGGNRVMSLWTGPDGCESFQETTIEALVAETESNQENLRSFMKMSLGEYTGEKLSVEDLERVLDSLYDYEDVLGQWEREWQDTLDELGEWEELSASQIADALRAEAPEHAALWDTAQEALGWGEADEESGKLFKLLMKVMELEDPERFVELKGMEGDYKAVFAEVADEVGGVGVVPQSLVWERMQSLVSQASPGAAEQVADGSAAVSAPVVVDMVEEAKAPGARVVDGALRLKGGMTWVLPACNEKGTPNDFEEFAKSGKPLTPQSSMNCWEAVIYAAMEGGVVDPALVREAFRDSMSDEVEYNEKIEDWLNVRASQPIEDCPPQAGDVLSFFGMSHIALSLGGDRVLSLWDGPDGCTSLQETTIGELLAKAESKDEELRACMKVALTEYGGGEFEDGQLESVLNSVYDYEEELTYWQGVWEEKLDDLGEWGEWSAAEILEAMEGEAPEDAAVWSAAMEAVGWGEKDEREGRLFHLLMKVMELEDPPQFAALEALEVKYKTAFEEVKGRLGVVAVIPQAEVWERMKELAG